MVVPICNLLPQKRKPGSWQVLLLPSIFDQFGLHTLWNWEWTLAKTEFVNLSSLRDESVLVIFESKSCGHTDFAQMWSNHVTLSEKLI